MRSSAEVVVIGGGIMGLGVAYHLAKDHRVKRVTVIEQSYLCGGASGRNGGGVRAQWSTETNVRLMREALERAASFASEMKINVWLRRGGYLFVARSEQRRRALEQSVRLQNHHGLATRMLDVGDARRVVPELDTTGIVAASYNPDDAVVFPWPFVWGYADAARRHGVEILLHTRVTGVDVEGRELRRVRTDKGDIETSTVVNAAGAWSPEIARLAGVELPNHPHRHEICSTEPLKPFLGPLVADLSNGLYFSQSTRGEIVGGISNADVPPGLDMDSSHDFLSLYARALVQACPILGRVKVLRQWAGCYDLTPDANPILGEVDEVPRFFQVSGFMGHGFMMAPAIAPRLAEHIVKGSTDPIFSQWNLRRYREGKLLSESMIIG